MNRVSQAVNPSRQFPGSGVQPAAAHGARPRAVAGLLMGAMVLALAAAPASAQLDRDRDKKKKPAPAPTQPTQPNSNQPGPPPAPTPGQILSREKMKDWTATLTLHVEAGSVRKIIDKSYVPEPRSFAFSSAAVVFPVLDKTAGHKLLEGDGGFKGELFWNEKLADAQPTFATGYAAGARLGRWELRNVEGRELDLKITMKVECFETVYDEAQAEKVPWPSTVLGVAGSALKSQMYVEYNGYTQEHPDPADGTVAEFVKSALGGKDPKSMPPARVAKVLAGAVMERIQPSGDGLLSNTNSSLRGFDLSSAPQTIRERRGNEHEITAVYAAVLRSAGIPARTVIGWDLSDSKSGAGSFTKGGGRGKFRSWVEFALVNEKTRVDTWVPVDVVRLRKASSRAKPIDQPWKYFGDNDELAYIIPLAFQFHPPATVVVQTPALWGWLTMPESQPHVASLMVTAFRTEKRGDDKDRSKRPGN